MCPAQLSPPRDASSHPQDFPQFRNHIHTASGQGFVHLSILSNKLTRNAGSSKGAPSTGPTSILGEPVRSILGEPVGSPLPPGYNGKSFKMGLYTYGDWPGKRGLSTSDTTWLTHEYSLVLEREIRPAAIYQEAEQRSLLWKLKTKPGLQTAPAAEWHFSPGA